MKRELKNGFAHAAGAILALAPAAYFGGVVGFTFAGFCYGLVREITEEQNLYDKFEPLRFYHLVNALGSWKDLLGWSIGGLLIGLATVIGK